MTGYELAQQVEMFISFLMRKKLGNEFFRASCEIKPAITKLEQDIEELQMEINQNENAINFLKQFKEDHNE